MIAGGTYDADELRALAVALDVLDPEDPSDWDGDADAFAASVELGRAALQRRGLANFARDGGATLDADEAGMLRAFLAPDAVFEAWIVDGAVARRREWYVGPHLSVVADPGLAVDEERELAVIDTPDVFAGVMAFLDLRGVDADGEVVRLAGDEIDDFRGRGTTESRSEVPAHPASRLMNVAAAWSRSSSSRELQLLDAGDGGLWIVDTVESRDGAGMDDRYESDMVDMIPVTRTEIIERILAVLAPDPLD